MVHNDDDDRGDDHPTKVGNVSVKVASLGWTRDSMCTAAIADIEELCRMSDTCRCPRPDPSICSSSTR
eukprot:9032440-Pyramimonas_sp.AAC.1